MSNVRHYSRGVWYSSQKHSSYTVGLRSDRLEQAGGELLGKGRVDSPQSLHKSAYPSKARILLITALLTILDLAQRYLLMSFLNSGK